MHTRLNTILLTIFVIALTGCGGDAGANGPGGGTLPPWVQGDEPQAEYTMKFAGDKSSSFDIRVLRADPSELPWIRIRQGDLDPKWVNLENVESVRVED